MAEDNNTIEMDSSSTYSSTEQVIAHILIEQNQETEMDTGTTYIPLTTIAETIAGQSDSELDTNAALNLLEKAIAQSMGGQCAIEIDGTTYITVETTAVSDKTAETNFEDLETNVASNPVESTTEEVPTEMDSEELETNAACNLVESNVSQSTTEQEPTEMDISTDSPEETATVQNASETNDSGKSDSNSSHCEQEKTVVETTAVQNQPALESNNSTTSKPRDKRSNINGYTCNICEASIRTKEEFTKHMIRNHGAERMRYFSCYFCVRIYKIRKNLISHVLQIHGLKFSDTVAHQEIFLNELEDEPTETEGNEWLCKASNCIRRKTNVVDQGVQTGCHCIPPTECCLFCRKDVPVELCRNNDSECICFENFFVPEKIISDAATGTGCERADCEDCEACPKFDIWDNNVGTGIQCLECNISFVRTNQLRNHLKIVHKIMGEFETHHFPDMTAFKKWKLDVERKEVACFITKHGSKRTSKGGLKSFYDCHRSGKYAARIPKQGKMVKKGSFKLGIICTASMYCEQHPEGVTVKYWPQHYGHGKETSFVQISPEEQVAIQESVSSGVSVENLLDDIRDHQSSSDQSQLYLMKKRDINFINKAYNAIEYSSGLSDADSVDQWVRTCCQMEESPILFYRQEFADSGEDFLLIIMTEFQKQILMSSDKQVVYVDSFFRQRGGRFYLTVLFVMDECDIAFPVAFCISSNSNKEVLIQFFSSIRESTGPLSSPYFMSDNLKYYHDAWLEVMGDNSKWLWCLWYVDSRIKLQLRHFKNAKRVDVYNTMQVLMECQNETVFQSIYKNFMESATDSVSKSMAAVVQKFVSNAPMWACCYRKEVKADTNIRLEAMHYTFRYCCKVGRKKRLDKFIFVIMKLVRRKMLDRLTNVLDEENMDMAVQAINMFHEMGLAISTENISSLSDKIWLIRTDEEGDVYVTCDLETCPEDCKLKCGECDICVHMYSCTCMNSMINANLCQHIHAIAWKFLTPHFSPAASPAPDHCDEDVDDPHSMDRPTKPADLLEGVLKRAHDVYKKVKASKSNLKKDTLTNIMKRLNECVDLCSGKLIEEEPQKEVYVLAPSDEGNIQPVYVSNSAMNASSIKQAVLQSVPMSSLRQPMIRGMLPTPLRQPILQGVPNSPLRQPIRQGVPNSPLRQPVYQGIPNSSLRQPIYQGIPTTSHGPSTEQTNTSNQYYVLVEQKKT